MVTFDLFAAPPCGSLTRPRSEPWNDCANAKPETRRTQIDSFIAVSFLDAANSLHGHPAESKWIRKARLGPDTGFLNFEGRGPGTADAGMLSLATNADETGGGIRAGEATRGWSTHRNRERSDHDLRLEDHQSLH